MAKEHNSTLKLEAYLDSIKHLQVCLTKKIQDTKDIDRKNDLKILLENSKCLDCDANKLAKFSFNDHKHKMENRGDSHKVTSCGLQQWMKCKFETLGWMCIAQKDGNMLSINAYFDSIETLIASIESKIKEVKEKDRKDDLKITLDNTKLLKHYAWHLLMEKDEKSMSKKSSSHNASTSHKASTSRKSSSILSNNSNNMSKKSTKSTKSTKSKKSKKSKKSTSWFS